MNLIRHKKGDGKIITDQDEINRIEDEEAAEIESRYKGE